MESGFTELHALFQRIKALTQRYRPLRMRLLISNVQLADDIGDMLLVQSCDVTERLNDGIRGTITCLSLVEDLPLDDLIGLPVELQIATDRRESRLIRVLIAKVVRGASDDARDLTLYQLHVADVLTFLAGQQRDMDIFPAKTLIEVSNALLSQLQQDSPAFGALFTWKWLVDQDRYPQREFWMRKNECVVACLFRLWRRDGIGWFTRAAEDGPRIEIVLFDSTVYFKGNPAGEIRIHPRNNGSEQRDCLLHWGDGRQVTVAELERLTTDYKPDTVLDAQASSAAPRGEFSRRISAALRDRMIEPPHLGNDTNELQRLTQVRMSARDAQAAWAVALSSAPELQIGLYTQVENPPGLEREPAEKRRYNFTYIRHQADSNIHQIAGRVAELLQLSERLDGWVSTPRLDGRHHEESQEGYRYLAAVVAAPHLSELPPLWNPDEHMPPMYPMTAVVAGDEGEFVHIDALGRVKVMFHGQSGKSWSAWIRVATFYAHLGAGAIFPLPAGTEVRIGFESGDERRPVVEFVYFNGRNRPPGFNDGGPLPGNKYLAGIHLHEHGTQNFGELVWDLTPHQSSVQLGSHFADTRLWLGRLYGRRHDGQGEPMGHGAYLHTLASVALRSGQGMLLSAWGLRQDDGPQMHSTEHQDQLRRAQELQQRMGEYASQHQGLPTDDKPQAKLLDDISQAQGGSNTDPEGQGGKPTLSLTAPEGVATSTPKVIVNTAGQNIDTVAGMNLQFVSGEATVINAKKGVSIFAHADGIRCIAHQGDLLLQSQHGATRIEAEGDIFLRSGGKLLLEAKDILLRNAAGTFISLEDAIPTIGASGPINVKTGGHNWSGPATRAANLPTFSDPAPVKFCADCSRNAAAAGLPVSMKK